MNKTIRPPMKTKNKIKENHGVWVIILIAKHRIKVCALMRMTIIIGWLELIRVWVEIRDNRAKVLISITESKGWFKKNLGFGSFS